LILAKICQFHDLWETNLPIYLGQDFSKPKICPLEQILTQDLSSRACWQILERANKPCWVRRD